MNPPLSLVICTKNEEKRLRKCIESAKDLVDEIIVVDDESTDNTVAIAKEYTDKVFIRKMELEGKQRNFAAQQISHDWLMFLDGDEQATPEVIQEIKEILPKHKNENVAFWIPFKNFFGPKWLEHGGWYPAAKLRIYNKNLCSWKEDAWELVHPGVNFAEGSAPIHLKEHILHQNWENVEHFIYKLNRHTTLDALKRCKAGKKIKLPKALWKTFDRFMRRYVRKKGHKDGFYGYAAAAMSGFYEFAVYLKMREIYKDNAYQ